MGWWLRGVYIWLVAAMLAVCAGCNLRDILELFTQRACTAPEAPVVVEPYTSNYFGDIDRILSAQISFGGKTWSYPELLGASKYDILESYLWDWRPPHDETERFMARSSDHVVGFGAVSPWDIPRQQPDPTLQSWMVTGLAVDPDYRSHGIGRKIFEHMGDWAMHRALERGKLAKSLFIRCLDVNTPACEAYKRWTDGNCVAEPQEHDILCEKRLKPLLKK